MNWIQPPTKYNLTLTDVLSSPAPFSATRLAAYALFLERQMVPEAKSRYTLVTVAHGEDYGLLCLQARSLNRYLDSSFVHQILVIKNPQPGRPTDWRRALRREYGGLATLVKLIDARELAEMPSYISGWYSQQILKLMSAHIITTDRYVVLDAKNHLVFPLTRSFFEGPSAKMRLYWVNYEGRRMQPFLENSLAYFELEPQNYVAAFLPTMTPFPLPTQIVRDLVRDIETKQQKLFPDAFVHDGFKLSEFFLFGAYLLACGRSLTDIYEFSGVECPIIGPQTGTQECHDMIARSEANALPVFGLHRRAIPRLDEATRQAVAAFWHRRRLFSNIADPLRFLSDFHRQTKRSQRRTISPPLLARWRWW